MPQPPTRRADAERNRQNILAAARTAFAGPAGADVSMAEVSRRAGVGMATLYRNFPNRRELLEALYVDEVDALCAAAATGGATAGAAFAAWLERFFVYFTSKRHVASALLEHTSTDDPVFDRNRGRVLTAGRPLISAAQDAGEVRTDVTLEQALDMVGAVAKIPADPAYLAPILATVLDGLRPPTGSG